MNLRITDTVKHLMIINVVLYAIASFLPNLHLFDRLSLHFFLDEDFGVWQIITHMFMHSEEIVFHLISNMIGLFFFGPPLENMWGRNKFLFFYISAGLGAVLLPWAIDYYYYSTYMSELMTNGLSEIESYNYLRRHSNIFNQSLGASGAIMGLLVAFGLNYPNAKLALLFFPVPIAAKIFIPLLLAYEIFAGISGGMTFFGANVAHFAHLGGALLGFIIAFYWKKNNMSHTRWN